MMTTLCTKFIANQYRDSVALMQLSAKLARLPGIQEASAQMATRTNLELIKNAGLIDELPAPRPNDIFLVLRGDAAATEAAVATAIDMLSEKAVSEGAEPGAEPLRSLQAAFEARNGRANLALISTPGTSAAAEGMKALRLGMNVMLFSDNVSEQEEIELKHYARNHKLLVMGPDCGTSIIDGIPLAFANVVQRGNIGVIGATGTGLQQVVCLIDQYGGGITHALGTGGHDLSEAVGGITMLTALEQFTADPATQVIVLISKPPSQTVAEKLLSAARTCGKPVVVCFLGTPPDLVRHFGLVPAHDLEVAARLAVALARGDTSAAVSPETAYPCVQQRAQALACQIGHGQHFLRALYTGGTFCYEAMVLLQDSLPDLWSNVPTGKVGSLDNVWQSQGHTLLDLGSDEFTRGHPHPMIDPTFRNERLLTEAADETVAIILLDFVLGYGSHEDPAGQILESLVTAREKAEKEGRKVLIVGHICGTKGDPQGLKRQGQILREAGVELTGSNAEAVRLCQAILEITRYRS